MNTLKTSFLVLLLFFPFILNGQIVSNNNLWHQDYYQLSPAFAGFRENFYASLNTNQSHVGFDNALETYRLAISGQTSDKVGIGAKFMYDRRGAFTANSFTGSYSYGIRFGGGQHQLRFGLSAGIYWQDFQVAGLNADLMDPVLQDGDELNETAFQADLGAWYSWRDAWVGISAPYLGQLFNHYLAVAGYNYRLLEAPALILYPSVLYQYLPDNTHQVDGTLKVGYEFAWISGTYRSNKNIVAAVGVSAYNFDLCYAYEFNRGDLNIISNTTQEIMLAYRFSFNMPGPRKSFEADKVPWEQKD